MYMHMLHFVRTGRHHEPELHVFIMTTHHDDLVFVAPVSTRSRPHSQRARQRWQLALILARNPFLGVSGLRWCRPWKTVEPILPWDFSPLNSPPLVEDFLIFCPTTSSKSKSCGFVSVRQWLLVKTAMPSGFSLVFPTHQF